MPSTETRVVRRRNCDPAMSIPRASKAGKASATHQARIKHALTALAKRSEHLTAADLARAAEVIASAPALTAEQAERLRALLPPPGR